MESSTLKHLQKVSPGGSPWHVYTICTMLRMLHSLNGEGPLAYTVRKLLSF